MQNGTKGRCRDGQRVLDELIEALNGDMVAVGGGRWGRATPALGMAYSA